jgi:hypothetical protein
VRWDYRGRPGPPAGVREPRVRWAARGSAVLVRIRLARVFGKPGRLSNYRTPSGAGVRTNEAGTDDDRGPPRPTRSTFYWHKQQKVERMEVRPGRARGRSAPVAAPGPFRRCAACCSLPRKVERVGRKADGAQDLCAQRTPAKRPGRPRNHPPHPAPGPDPRNLKPAAEARPPAGARRGGASYASISTQKSPHPPRETGAWASYASRRLAPPASGGCFVVVDRGPPPDPTGDAPVPLRGHRASTERNDRAVAAMRSQRRERRETGGAIVSRAVPS